MMLETFQEYAKDSWKRAARQKLSIRRMLSTLRILPSEPSLNCTGLGRESGLTGWKSKRTIFRLALGWAYHKSLDLGLRLVAALNIYWNRRGYLIEGRDRAAEMVSRARENGMTVVVEGAKPVSLPIKGPMQSSMARALYTLGLIAFRQANYPRQHGAVWKRAYEIYRGLRTGRSSDTRGLVEALNVLGIVAKPVGEYARPGARCMRKRWPCQRGGRQLEHCQVALSVGACSPSDGGVRVGRHYLRRA